MPLSQDKLSVLTNNDLRDLIDKDYEDLKIELSPEIKSKLKSDQERARKELDNRISQINKWNEALGKNVKSIEKSQDRIRESMRLFKNAIDSTKKTNQDLYNTLVENFKDIESKYREFGSLSVEEINKWADYLKNSLPDSEKLITSLKKANDDHEKAIRSVLFDSARRSKVSEETYAAFNEKQANKAQLTEISEADASITKGDLYSAIVENLETSDSNISELVSSIKDSREDETKQVELLEELINKISENSEINQSIKDNLQDQVNAVKKANITEIADQNRNKRLQDTQINTLKELNEKIDKISTANNILDDVLDSRGFEELGEKFGEKIASSIGGGDGDLLSSVADAAGIGGAIKNTKAGSAIGKILRAGGKFLGRAFPIAALGFGAMDAVDGFTSDADDLYGKDASVLDRGKSALASIASGLTFGLVDKKSIHQFFGMGKYGKNYGSDSSTSFNPFGDSSSAVLSNENSGKYQFGEQDSNPIAQVIKCGPGYNIVKRPDGTIEKQKGDRNWRNNNPGNLEYGKFTKSKGAIGSDGRFAIFPTYEMGRKAKEDLIFNTKGYKYLTLPDAISRYAPPSENNTYAYISNALSSVGGAIKQMQDYNPSERENILNAIQKQEGFRKGQVTEIGKSDAIPDKPKEEEVAPKLTPEEREAQIQKIMERTKPRNNIYAAQAGNVSEYAIKNGETESEYAERRKFVEQLVDTGKAQSSSVRLNNIMSSNRLNDKIERSIGDVPEVLEYQGRLINRQDSAWNLAVGQWRAEQKMKNSGSDVRRLNKIDENRIKMAKQEYQQQPQVIVQPSGGSEEVTGFDPGLSVYNNAMF